MQAVVGTLAGIFRAEIATPKGALQATLRQTFGGSLTVAAASRVDQEDKISGLH